MSDEIQNIQNKKAAKKKSVRPESEKKLPSSREKNESGQTDLYIESILLKGEKIVLSCRVHWGVYWKSAAIFFFAMLVGLLIAPQLGFILLVASFVAAIHAYFMSKMLLLVLTNKRVLMRYGILQVDVVDMRFRNIESIELERMLPGFLLGYSNVIVMGIGQRVVRIPYLTNGVTFRRAFNELVLGNEEEEVAAPQPANERKGAAQGIETEE